MRTLLDIKPNTDYTLDCTFDNGEKKTISLTSLIDLPVFRVLRDITIFNKISNKKYFIEWTDVELDLSADTLYHL